MVISVLAHTNTNIRVACAWFLMCLLCTTCWSKTESSEMFRMYSMECDMEKTMVWVWVGGRHWSAWALARSDWRLCCLHAVRLDQCVVGALVILVCLADFVFWLQAHLYYWFCHVIVELCKLSIVGSINRIRVIQIPDIYLEYIMYVKPVARTATLVVLVTDFIQSVKPDISVAGAGGVWVVELASG